MRSYVGARSVMRVYVFQPQGDALSPQAIAFLDGVRRRWKKSRRHPTAVGIAWL